MELRGVRRFGGLCLFAFVAGLLSGFAIPAAAYDLIFDGNFQVVADAPASDAAAARFLTMATFGPTQAEITRLRGIGVGQWIQQQLAMPATPERPYVENLDSAINNPGQNDRLEIWFDNAITAPDQLRQRVAWALSQIMVASDQGSKLRGDPISLSEYYDVLARDAFGYYDANDAYHKGTINNLLTDVTYSPAMGKMLTYLHNEGQFPLGSGLSPDENYAREVMQLFSIGLIERNSDFSPMLVDGNTVPTYDQNVITANARVFTGLSWNFVNPKGWNGYIQTGPSYSPAMWMPMSCYEDHHDEGTKTTVDGIVIDNPVPNCDQVDPTSKGDIKQLINVLANHHNTAPFISRQLIERLVTSNPSPQYIQRVVNVFNDNGHGLYGDIGAVVAAILTDPEATTGVASSTTVVFGKLREPLLKLTALWRYYGAAAPDGSYLIAGPFQKYGESPLESPSVFNFYLPDYLPPGEMADAGLFGPEFQISGESSVVSVANDLTQRANQYVGASGNGDSTVAINIASLVALATDPAALIDQLNHDLMYGGMSTAMRATMIDLVTAVSTDPTKRVTSALQVLLASPEFSIQK
jgi:uncharacterized protein (DUF1800 family)